MKATIEMLQAFSDEVERQREKHGWPKHPVGRVADYPEDELAAGLAALDAALAVAPK